MSTIQLVLALLAEFVPAHPSYEITAGSNCVHDGIWDAFRTSSGSFVCCGYTGSQAWFGSLSPFMEIDWQYSLGSGSHDEEALAICPFLRGYAVAINSGVISPGARHQLLDSEGWILLIDEEGGILDSLSCSTDERRTIAGITSGPGNSLACCGITYSSRPQGSGAFWLIDSLGSITSCTDFGSDSIVSLSCIKPLPGGGYVLGGSSSIAPSFTVIRIDPHGHILWITRTGHESLEIEARDVIVTACNSCIAVGGGLWDDPLAVELDMDTGELVTTVIDEGWLSLFDCGLEGGRILYLGHNMLCDGADSETFITSSEADDSLMPLRITGHGACRCRRLMSSGDTLFVFGEVSECWDGHQDIWAAATVSSDWIPAEDGSRLNADFD